MVALRCRDASLARRVVDMDPLVEFQHFLCHLVNKKYLP